ncbi:MAG: aminoacyl-tRNA deacylase [Planctomycetota bacterium]
MPIRTLKNYLDSHNIKYVTLVHSPAYTAQEIAQSAHVPGHEMAKTVILKLDDRLAMAVLSADCSIDFELLGEITGAESITLADEQEFMQKFPNCEVGAMPPFGTLYDMETYLADELTDAREIVFNAGTHTELIRMSYDDYVRLAKPRIIRFTCETLHA